MPATAFAHVGMTLLLLPVVGRSQERVQRKVFRVGMANLVRVGRGGGADMAGKRPLCGEDR